MSEAHGTRIARTLVVVALCSLTAAHAASDFYEDALARFRNHDYKGTIVTLKNALQAEPGNLSALVLMGRTLLKLGNGAAAEQTLRRARDDGADKALITVPLGQALLAQHKYEQILDEFSIAGEPKPLQLEILVLQGKALVALDRTDEARKLFKQATTLDPFNAAPRVGIASIALAEGNSGIAAAHSAKAVVLDPNSEDAWTMNGEAQRLQGKLEMAVESYSRALTLNPRHENARIARAATLIDLKREAQALVDIEYVQKQNPRQPQASYLRALLLSKEGKLEEATAMLATTAQMFEGADPKALNKSAPMLLLAGVIANTRGNYEQARSYLQRFIKLDPEHAMARRLLGTILVRQRESRLAINVLTPALKQARKDPVLQATLGIAYRQEGLYAESVSALARAVQLSPNPSPGLRIELARSRLAAGQRLTAASELEAIVARGAEATATATASVLLTYLRLDQNDLEGALASARAGSEASPNNLQAHLLLGDTLARARDAAAAAKSYSRALEIEPGSLPALYGLANAEVLQGQLASAIARYEAMLEQDPAQVQAMLGLAVAAKADNRFTDARRWLEKARATDGSATGPQFALVALLLQQDLNGDALRAATRLADTAPEDVRAILTLARAQAANGDRDAAKTTARRIKSMPKVTAAQLTAIARIQLALGDLEGVRNSLAVANARDPYHLPSQAAMVALDLFEKRDEDAMNRARAVRDRHPKRALGPLLVGDVLTASERYGPAAAAFEEAVAREPTPTAKVKLFQARWRAGRKEEAIAGINAWLATEPDNPMALRQLAEAYLSERRLEEAQKLHERLVVALPDDAGLYNNLAWLYQTRGDARALATAERAIALAPEQTSTLDTYGWILLESGQPKQALKILRKAQVRAADNPWVRYHTAQALSRLGRNDEARDLLRELLASGVPFENAKEARALLDSLPKG